MNRKVLTIITLMIMLSTVLFGTGQVSVASADKQNEAVSPASAHVNAAPPVAGQMNPNFTPYFGKSYEQPEQVKELYPEPDIDFDTPGFKAGKWNFTSQEEMMAFLEELDRTSDVMKMKTAGHSLEGRELPLLIFSTSSDKNTDDFKRKTTIMLEGQIHGNEPAGGESMLVMAQKLAKGDLGENVLEDINVLIVPRINLDGSYYFQRQTANRLDANRDHVKLELPEVRTLHKIFNQFKPEVVISAHEYGTVPGKFPDVGEQGALPYHDILLAPGYNLNIPKTIRNKSTNWFVEPAHKDIEEKGFSSAPYYIVDRSQEKTTIAEGGLEARLDTNAYGLQPSFTILVESRGIGIGRENFERRVTAMVAAHTSLVKTTAKRATEIRAVVKAAKAKISRQGGKIGNNDKIVLDSQRKELPGEQQLKVVDIAKGSIEKIPVNYYSSKEAEPTLERVRPTAYIMPPAYHEIAQKLETQGVIVKKLEKAKELTVEHYKVTDKEVDEQYYQGHLLNHVKTKIEEQKYLFPKGSYVFSSAQPAANLIALALEPESSESYVTFNYLPVNVGDIVPVYRYMEEEKLVKE
ncbi:M14 family metallopeptidase [Pseudalkalibacillus decolorationis]|uniref:M14 family metallopeptidase n=1 Tax=Pseudalkalibacillus decolorationis TaxID=163879 RepID=UPI00214726C1|nr:M14 family metallocarboxypeptidase [Pseudalkalibacillus decolorationis]